MNNKDTNTVDDLPFAEDGIIRTFSETVLPEELKWHWDEQDRFVSPIHETDWLFQYDNELPIELRQGVRLFIQAGTWHRLIRGTGSLSLEVHKCLTKD